MSMIEIQTSPQNGLTLRAPDRVGITDHPGLQTLPGPKLRSAIRRFKSIFTLPAILPAHPEAPEPSADKTENL